MKLRYIEVRIQQEKNLLYCLVENNLKYINERGRERERMMIRREAKESY